MTVLRSATVSELRQGDDAFDRDWHRVATLHVPDGMKADIALLAWLEEHDPPAGSYRIEIVGDGWDEIHWHGPRAVA